MTTPKTTARRTPATPEPAAKTGSRSARANTAPTEKAPTRTVRPRNTRPPAAKEPLSVSPEQRLCMIQDAAYYRAESRAFRGGDPMRDWLEAEAEIDRLLGATRAMSAD